MRPYHAILRSEITDRGGHWVMDMGGQWDLEISDKCIDAAIQPEHQMCGGVNHIFFHMTYIYIRMYLKAVYQIHTIHFN